MPRMNILNALEQEAFESPPELNSIERKRAFDFPRGILTIAQHLRMPSNRVCFLVSSGYFKATKRFFSHRLNRRDVKYVAEKIGLSISDVDLDAYDKQTLLRHQELILDFYGFRAFDQGARTLITEEIQTMVGSQLRPKLILLRAVDILIKEKVEVPTYHALADIILEEINTRKERLTQIIERELSSEARSLLDALLVQTPSSPGDATPSQTASYRLTLLKKLSQSTRPSRVKESVADLQLLQGVYHTLQPVLSTLGLNYEGIRYYAHSVIKSEIFQISRRSDEDRYLHLIAFIAHQYCRLQDNLVDVLLTVLQTYINTTQREHKERCYARRDQRSQAVNALVSCLDSDLLDVFSTIQILADADDLSDAQKLGRIRSVLHGQEPVRQQIQAHIDPLKQDLEGEQTGEDYYRILEARSVRIQNRISPILKAISFQGEATSADLMQAIEYFKEKDGILDSEAPVGFLRPTERNAVMREEGQLRVSLYKAFLFIHVMGAVKSGTLNLEHSYKYRPLDQYLLDRERWQRERTSLVQRAGLQDFAYPKHVLSQLDHVLQEQYTATNQNIHKGRNPFVTCTKDGTIRISTPKQEGTETEALQTLFPERHYISLPEVLSTVNRYSRFLEELQHGQQRYHRPKPPPRTFFAGITGLGCGIGTRKLSQISRQLDGAELEHTVNWYFSQDNLHAANDKVLSLVDRMELPNIYRRSPDALHTASDGQKFEVSADSLNANYSFKYFGRGKGVSVYSFIDERHLLFHSTVISAAERESAYVIDGLMHNEVVKSDIHSTDTHGYSEAIFGIMHLLGFSYAPRIKNLKRQRLYLFKSRQNIDRSWWALKPSGYINTELIEDNWDDILRFIATIQLKETTASDLFRRLNSYSKQHALYRALKAFGRTIKSIFILRYIDDLELRQAVEKQLNKVESAHRFARAISVGNPREFTQAEKHEQEIAEGCKRLIKNAIICWNYLYLTQKINEEDNPEHQQILLQAIARGSIVAWQHINLLGEYDFSEERLRDTVGIKPPKILISNTS